MRVARRFEQLLDAYRRPDGSRWNGQQLQAATGGTVTRSYVSMLRRGKIGNPGFDKLRAIAKAMGFSPELWFGEGDELGSPVRGGPPEEKRDIAGRLNHLLENMRNERTGERYTDAELALMSLGDLTEEEVAGIRTGAVVNPTVGQVMALAEVLGVHPSYFIGAGTDSALLGEREMSALADRRSREILNRSLGLSEREKDMVLDMIEHLATLHGA